ncbi:acyltransferase family protein [Flavobacterium sp. N1719]|uniref:acyltransferase family protein n=1 Tax=Flavobacterium sp. N1719 TaxID=2885633 RepID=UPI002221B927|nr:acyltransferase [Flavobacterium sp. N1719]
MRIDQLTFTRFLAAVAIVIYHFGKRIFPFNADEVSFLVKHANIGVSYFYILSGFIMIISYGRSQKVAPLDYYKNRIARIYPVYLLGFLFYFPICIMINYPIDYTLIANATMLQSWMPGWVMRYNFPGWSVSVEMLFYFLFPLLFNYGYSKPNYRKAIFIGIVLFWVFSQLFFHYMIQHPYYKGEFTPSHELLFYHPLFHLNEFLVGNLAGLWFLRQGDSSRKNYDWIVLSLVVLIALALKYPMGMNYHNGLFAVLLVPLILFISLNTGRITQWFLHPKLVYLGEISYGVYIYQLPVFYYLKPMPIDNQLLAFGIKLAVLLLLSMVSYRFIEIPLRNKIKKIDLRFLQKERQL